MKIGWRGVYIGDAWSDRPESVTVISMMLLDHYADYLFPVRDDVPRNEKPVKMYIKAIKAAIEAGDPIMFRCAAGLSRSVIAAILYVAVRDGVTPDRALKWYRQDWEDRSHHINLPLFNAVKAPVVHAVGKDDEKDH